MAESCSIANQHCKAAANFENARTYTKCWDCEQPVCTAGGCSALTKKHPLAKGKRVRVCSNCAADKPEILKLIDAGIYKGSGYPEGAKDIKADRFRPNWIKPEWEFISNPPHPMKMRWLKSDLDAYQAGMSDYFLTSKGGVPPTRNMDTAFYFAGCKQAEDIIATGVSPSWLKRNVYEAV